MVCREYSGKEGITKRVHEYICSFDEQTSVESIEKTLNVFI